jgi:hypothetical protein
LAAKEEILQFLDGVWAEMTDRHHPNFDLGHTIWNADQKSRKFVFGSRRTLDLRGAESIKVVVNGDEKADITTWFAVSMLGDKG